MAVAGLESVKNHLLCNVCGSVDIVNRGVSLD